MLFWKKLLLGIVIGYLLIAVVRLIAYGWAGVGDFFLGPFNVIIGIFQGLFEGLSKAPESFEAGRESARASLNN